jgi:hypothetical protein
MTQIEAMAVMPQLESLLHVMQRAVLLSAAISLSFNGVNLLCVHRSRSFPISSRPLASLQWTATALNIYQVPFLRRIGEIQLHGNKPCTIRSFRLSMELTIRHFTTSVVRSREKRLEASFDVCEFYQHCRAPTKVTQPTNSQCRP